MARARRRKAVAARARDEASAIAARRSGDALAGRGALVCMPLRRRRVARWRGLRRLPQSDRPETQRPRLTDSLQSCAFTAWFTGTIVRSSVPSSTRLLSLRDAAAALARAQSDIRRAGGVATAGRLLGHGAAARDVLAVGMRGSRPSGLDKRRTLGRRMPRHATTTRSTHAAEPPGTAGDRGRSLGARGTTRRPGEGFHGTAAPLPWKAGQLPWKGRPARVAARNRRGWPAPYQDASPTGWPRMRASGDRGVPI